MQARISSHGAAETTGKSAAAKLEHDSSRSPAQRDHISAARVPVLLVMYLAMSGNSGAGCGTHYDAILPVFAQLSFAQENVIEALIPQMTLWIGWTIAVGALNAVREGLPVAPTDSVLCADEKTSIQVRRRRHCSLPTALSC